MLDGACFVSSKNNSIVMGTVRSPKHVEKQLKILAQVENKPILEVAAEDFFKKYHALPTLRYSVDQDKVVVTGDTKFLAGFLESVAFEAKAEGSAYSIQVKDDLSIADIVAGAQGPHR